MYLKSLKEILRSETQGDIRATTLEIGRARAVKGLGCREERGEMSYSHCYPGEAN